VIVCVAPNPSIDKLFSVPRLEPGAIHRPASFVQVPGGKGLNVARAAFTLGADVRAVALLGGHHGRWIATELVALGLPYTAVWHDGETRSSLSVADADSESLT
jgi:fructose-1-phosphate kinase PfkB-like protein